MTKSDLFAEILKSYQKQVERLATAALNSAQGATSDEVKSEGKYDTRGAEASYLTAGQSEQAEIAQAGLEALKNFTLPDFSPDDTISSGALVETEENGTLTYYFLLPHAGGITADYDGFDVAVLTPDAPLYQALLGKAAGSLLEESDQVILDVI